MDIDLNPNNILIYFNYIHGSIVLTKRQVITISEDTFNGLDRKLYRIYLSENKIEILPSNLFNGLQFLWTLDLACNNISEINENTFSGLENLENLYLEKNNISILRNLTFNLD